MSEMVAITLSDGSIGHVPADLAEHLNLRRAFAEHLPGKHAQSRHGRGGGWTGPNYTRAEQMAGLKSWVGGWIPEDIAPAHVIDRHEDIQRALAGDREWFVGEEEANRARFPMLGPLPPGDPRIDVRVAKFRKEGEALLQMTTEAPASTVPLYRGMATAKADYTRWDSRKVGDTYTHNITSFSSDQGQALGFMERGKGSYYQTGSERIALTLKPGARAVDVNATLGVGLGSGNPLPREMEHLTAGTFRITSKSVDANGILTFEIEQVAPASSPDEITKLSEATLAEHLAGKHDQTRHGRGKGYMPKAEFESLLHGDATDALKGTFPNLDRAHLGGMTPENQAEAIEALNDLGRRYPKTAASLRQVNTADLGHGTLAETDLRTGVITFNRRGYDGGPTDKGLHAMAKVVTDGKPLLVDASAGGAATHEYAHLMEQTTLKRRQHWAWAADSLPYIGPSGYGSQSIDLSERLAELVTARVRGKPLGANEIDFVDRFIADVEGKRAVASEALVEHLPGKHDQSRHGRGGHAGAIPGLNAQVDIGLCDEAGQKIIVDTLSGLAAKYPRSASEIDFVRVVPQNDMARNLFGEPAIAQYHSGTNELRINAEHFARPGGRKRYREESEFMAQMGGIYDGSHAGALTHEFGHVVADRAGLSDAFNGRPATDYAVSLSVRVNNTRAPSSYGDSNTAEGFAEMFVAVARPNRAKMALLPDAAAVVNEVIGLAEGKASESFAEHLPGKHDQSRHGRKGAWTGPPATGSAAQYVGMKTSRAEEWIAGKSTEVALISKGGVVIWAKEGDNDSVEFDEAEFEAMKGTVHSHNHPASTGPSSHDLYLAASADLAEARIVGRDGSLMTIKPGPKGWPPKATVWTAVNTFDEQVKSEFWPKINLPEDLGPPQGWPWARSDRLEFANKAHWREVTKRTAADLGFIYAETSR